MHSQLQHNSLCFLLLSRMENVVRNIQACFQTPKHLGMRSSFFTALIQQEEESFQHVLTSAKALQGQKGCGTQGLRGSRHPPAPT